MKIMHEHIDFSGEETIKVKWDDFPHFTYPWHFHSEFEIVYVIKSYGTRYVADNIGSFRPGDIVMLGNNLPHFWKNDEVFHQGRKGYSVKAIVVQFPKDFFNKEIEQYPEFYSIKKLFANASKGIHFNPPTSVEAGKLLKKLLHSNSFERMILFLKLLNFLAQSSTYKLLASEAYNPETHQFSGDRLGKIMRYINNNYQDKVSLNEVADMVGLHPAAFCRYFKEKTGKQFSAYVNDMRIGYACKLLIDGQYSISQICFESGFNNISNFNRIFKKKTGYAPSAYQSEFHKGNKLLVEN